MAIGQVDGMGGQDLVLAIPAKKQVIFFRNGKLMAPHIALCFSD